MSMFDARGVIGLDVRRQRLLSQRISRPAFRSAEEVVAWLGAVQAQDYAAAKWALGLRMQGATDDDVEQAFARGDILRIHVLRPTWHFVTARDIRWMLALTAPRVHAANSTMYRRLELDAGVFKRSSAAMLKALEGGVHLTRNELRAVLAAAGVTTEGTFRMSYLMMHAELEGIVCSGPRRGRQFTYALLDERVPVAETLGRDEALAELARRYFTSRGPSRVHDFAKWSGLTVAAARSGLGSVRDELRCEVLGAEEYWYAGSDASEDSAISSAQLLSVYDEYVSGYRGWGMIVEEAVSRQLIAMDNALNSIVIVDGEIVGTWKRTVRKRDVLVEVNILRQLDRAERRAVTSAIHEYGDFLGLAAVEA